VFRFVFVCNVIGWNFIAIATAAAAAVVVVVEICSFLLYFPYLFTINIDKKLINPRYGKYRRKL
jgi:hypothetical protein